MDVVCLDSSESFDATTHKTLTKKLVRCGLAELAARWVEKCLNGWAQGVVIVGQRLIGGEQLTGHPRGQCWVQSCLSSSLVV